MASTKPQEVKEQAPTAAPSEAPSGFKKGGVPDIDGWYTPKEGVAFQGKMLARIEIPGMNDEELRDVVLVELEYPLEAFLEGGTPIQLKVGQVLAVGIRHQLREMLQYVEHQGRCWVKAVSQKKLKGGRSMWKFEQSYSGKRSQVPVAATRRVADDSVPTF